MSKRTATLDPDAGEVRVSFHLGDGVVADWTLRMDGERVSRRTWTGTNNDRLSDEVTLDARALDPGVSLTWVVVFFGPGAAVDYHMAIKVKQGGKSILNEAIAESGRVKARSTEVASGSIAFEVS